MKEIKLTRGRAALVSEQDFDDINNYRWFSGNHGYAARMIRTESGIRKTLLMHVQIIGSVEGLEIDHVNGNTLDNRRDNLRHVTHSQNMANQVKTRGVSEFKGVSWKKRNKKWMAQIYKNSTCFYIGLFLSETEAAMAYNKRAVELFGNFAKLNQIEREVSAHG